MADPEIEFVERPVHVGGPHHDCLHGFGDLLRIRAAEDLRVALHPAGEDVDFLRGVIPTAENLARSFWQELAPAIPAGELYEVVLQETERNSVRYRGEDEESPA